MSVSLCQYGPEYKDEWNRLVNESKNATFILDRNFMDYHADRFLDASLVFRNAKGRAFALLPANIDNAARTVYSHQGLTYGGLVVSREAYARDVFDALAAACEYYAGLGAVKLCYKPIPYIYNRYPSQEDLYFLFRHGAELEARSISQTIFIPDRIRMDKLRRRCAGKSVKAGHTVSERHDVGGFWNILSGNLWERHGVRPVHTAAEMELLMSRFPDRIKLYVVENPAREIVAGTVVFDMGRTVHTQYIAASAEGKATGAFDHLVDFLLTQVYAGREYFDFGISTESGGTVLNEGLMFQKESFGGRGVCYDTWSLNLQQFGQSDKQTDECDDNRINKL